MSNIGINVIETDGTAAPAIVGAATSTAAFTIRTKRGVPHRPVLVTSFADFVQRFGDYDADALGAYLVRGFFDNGGRRAYINRVVGAGANAPAVAELVLRAGTGNAARDILRLQAGFRGTTDPGTWANGLTIATAPTFSTSLRTGTNLTAGGATLNTLAGFSVGTAIVVSDGTRSSTSVVTTLDPATGQLSWAPNVANVGDFDNALTTVGTADFDLDVKASTATNAPVIETWTNLSMDRASERYVVRMINDPVRGSRTLFAVDPRPANQGAAEPPGTATPPSLAGGTDGTIAATDFTGSDAANPKTGFFAFDPFDVQLVATETTDAAVVTAALAYCENRGDCMFVGSVPEASVGSGTAIEYGARFQGKKVYGALYGPWIKVLDPRTGASAPYRWIPPTGHVMGIYARTEANRGIHKAPAGDEARVMGALDIEHRLSEADHTTLVKTGSVNGIRAVPGAGIVVDASRTLSTDPRWMYVGVRLLFNYVKSSLRSGLRWVRQEPNRDTLWNTVKYGSVTPFLLGLWRQGAFGTGEPADVFTVVCDATNNPPDEVDKGNFNVEVFFYPSKPAETIKILVGQQSSGGSAGEA